MLEKLKDLDRRIDSWLTRWYDGLSREAQYLLAMSPLLGVGVLMLITAILMG